MFFEFFAVLATQFLCVVGVSDNKEHGVMLILTLRRLRRYLFVYLGSKFLTL